MKTKPRFGQTLVWGLVPFAAMALFASCTYGAQGIFYSIEKEQKIVDAGGFNKYASMDSMAELGSTYYLASGAALYTRSTTGTSWSASKVDGKSRTVSVGSIGSTLWAVAGDSSGTNQLYSSTNGTSWTAQTLSGGENPVNMIPIYDQDGFTIYGYFVNTYTSAGGYNKVYFINTSGLSGTVLTLSVSGVTGISSPLLGASLTGAAGSRINAVSRSYLWFTNAAEPPTTITDVAYNSGTIGQDLSALMYVNGTGLYVGTAGGTVVFNSSAIAATNWTPSSTIVSNATANSITVRISNFFYNSVKSVFMVASNGTGYAEISGTTFNSTPSATISTSNYNSSVLPTSSVTRFFKASDGTLFLGTMGAGLWKWNSSNNEWSLQ